ncbi:caspase-8-like [Saccostrea cucullata]|uniref:caspase-8-like n=1 Tax=Saccostrea cuccullata TaxID=36930 RepID=UPI002ED3A425
MTNDFWKTTNKLPFVWEDGIMLWKMLEHLDFNVIWHANHSARQMLESLKEDVKITKDVGKIITCCVSSHGEQSVILGQDKKAVWIKRMVDTLVTGDSEISIKLKDKPKLFLIDACQGDFLQKTFEEDVTKKKIKFDVTQDFSRIAENADVLLGFAAYQGTVSNGVTEGSYYIDELTKYLPTHTKEDIHAILAGVCKQVQSIVFQDKSETQLPMVFSTLTKKLIFSNH